MGVERPWREFGAAIGSYFKRRIYVFSQGELEALCRRYHTDAYVTPYRYHGLPGDFDAPKTGDFYLDLDGDLEAARQGARRAAAYLQHYLRAPVRVYFSGAKGFHVVVPAEVIDLPPRPDLHLVYRALAEEVARVMGLAIDTRVYDRCRLLRVSNTKNGKTGLYKVLLSEDELVLPIGRILELARSPRPEPPFPPGMVRLPLPSPAPASPRRVAKRRKVRGPVPCLEVALRFRPECGRRHITAMVLACLLAEAGENPELLWEWNSSLSEPLPEREVRDIIRSAGRYTYSCFTVRSLGLCPGC